MRRRTGIEFSGRAASRTRSRDRAECTCSPRGASLRTPYSWLRRKIDHVVPTAANVYSAIMRRIWTLAVIGLLVGCGDDTKPGGTSSASGAALIYRGSTCATCDATSCQAERDSCGAEPECAAYLDCLGGCPLAASGDADPACESGCRAVTEPSAEAALSVFDSCRKTGAGATCTECGRSGEGGSGGAGGQCTPPALLTQQCTPKGETSCTNCVASDCCDSVDAVSHGEGAQVFNCVDGCGGDGPCLDACYDAHPGGVAAFAGLQACSYVNCGAPEGPCGIKTNCNQCRWSDCACEASRCYADASCFRLDECFGHCPPNDVDCANGCYAMYPDAQPLLSAMGVCLLNRCADQCGGN